MCLDVIFSYARKERLPREAIHKFSAERSDSQGEFLPSLKSVLDLNFMRKLAAPYYGDCGQQSIDPEVFIQLMLVGYLGNIFSDRGLIAHCSMRLDILFFVGYVIDEELPWHSTISRTRALLYFMGQIRHILSPYPEPIILDFSIIPKTKAS